MEKYHLNANIPTICLNATSFPEGIEEAHKRLHAAIGNIENRKYFGISFPDKSGTITYLAAAEEMREGEARSIGFDTFLIKKGEYISFYIKNYIGDIAAIGEAFQTLIVQPGIDPQGACVEWYLNDTDVRCMVRLKDVE